MGGLTLPQLLRAESDAGIRKGHKAVIMIFLPGGPSHQDMFDLKPDAPAEFRGEFKPIDTNVPGIQICEHLPLMAGMMDKLVTLRSIVGGEDRHSDFQCTTGHTFGRQPIGGWPHIGSVISKLQGPVHPSIPPFMGMEPRMQHRPYNDSSPGFLGISHKSFRPEADAKADMVLNGVTLDRLADRKTLLASFDRFRRDVDASGAMEGMDSFNQQALGMLTSSRLVEALDLTREDPKRVERYGKGDPKVHGDAAPMRNDQFLMARRLVEAGARFVTVAYGFWDSHSHTHKTARKDLPMLDQGVTALIQDLHDRGMDKEVTVIVWGEFGRTPKINKDGGRDHWPRVTCALLACGGLKTGQSIGTTDRLGGEADERPIHFQEVFATLYHQMGITANKTTVNDLAGRPRYLVDGYEPMPELV